jgi:hypothetical protein
MSPPGAPTHEAASTAGTKGRLRGILAALAAELKRLNSIGLESAAHRTRHSRSAAFREVLARRYRHRPPCC